MTCIISRTSLTHATRLPSTALPSGSSALLMSIWAICLLTPAIVASAAPYDAATLHGYLTPERMTQLEQGEIISVKEVEEGEEGKRSAGKGIALVLIDAPLETAWSVLKQPEKYHEFMPRVKQVSVLTSGTNEAELHYKLKVAWKEVEYHLDEVYDEGQHHLAFKIDPDKENDIKHTEGAWLLVPHKDGGTIAIYSVEADTGMAVPGFIENWLMNRDLPGVVEAVKKRAEEMKSRDTTN